MKPEEAEAAYNREWPAFDERLQRAKAKGNPKVIKRARQALSALSVKYDERHVRTPEPEPVNTYDDIKALLDACIEHLEYVDYGDNWEKECAEELRVKIERYQLDIL